MATTLAAIPARYRQLSTPPTAIEATIAQLGLSIGFYAAYLTASQLVVGLAFFLIAAIIVWRRSDEAIALFVSLFLVLLGAVNAGNAQALEDLHPALLWPTELALFLTDASLILFFFVFPDGRFVPRWSRIPAFVLVALLLVTPVLTGDSFAQQGWFAGRVLLSGFACGVLAQIYRYRYVSTRLQRQQTKWVVFGTVAAFMVQLAAVLPIPLYASLAPRSLQATPYDLPGVTVVSIGYSLIPLAIGIAILRYRLWDIDVIINRTLVYGALTACVVGLYVLVVGALGALLQVPGNLLISLLATGLIAVLFQPLRERLQRSVNRLIYGERDDPYRVLARLGQRLETTLAPDAVLPTIVETVKDALKLPYTAIALKQDDTLALAAAAGEPTLDTLRIPLVYQGETVGQLLLSPRAPGEPFTPADRRLLDDLARSAGVAAHAVLLTADLERSRLRVVSAREEARRRLGSDLHDGLGHRLAGLVRKAETAANLLEHDVATARALMAELTQQTKAAIAEVRALAHQLHPPELELLGLVEALRERAQGYAAESGDGLQISIEAAERLPRLPAAVEVAAYYITLEALTNVQRHSAAHQCSVRLALAPRDADDISILSALDVPILELEISDNGRGIAARTQTPGSGLGMRSMQERAAELGGRCVIEEAASGGTRVYARLPCADF